MPKHFNFPTHFLMILFEGDNEIDGWRTKRMSIHSHRVQRTSQRTFAQNFPFASFHPPIRWQLVTKLIKEVLHLFPPFPLCQFM